MGTSAWWGQRGWGMGGDEHELEIEIDLTIDAPDGLLPIRWVEPMTFDSVPTTNGNGAHHGNGFHHEHGNGNGHAPVVRTAIVPAFPAPRVATLASFIPPAVPMSTPEPDARVITLVEPDDWYDAPRAITVGRVMASRGARFLTIVAVITIVALVAAVVMLWQRVEEPHRPVTPVESTMNSVTKSQLRAVENRLNSLETKLTSMLDADGVVVNAPDAAVIAYQLAALQSCVNRFQQAIDLGKIRGGQFSYC